MRVRNARWHPFDDGGTGDFDVQEIADHLGLTNVAKNLLELMLEKLELTFWFHKDTENKEELLSIEVSAFWFDRHIGDADLLRIFDDVFDEIGGWEPDEEIAVLQELKAKIEDAIKAREEQKKREEQEEKAIEK